MECGLTGKLKAKFQKLCQRHSELFFKSPDYVPCLRRRDGSVIEETLGLREDAVLKFRPPIGLSTEQRKVLGEYIERKLKNGTLKRLEPQPWSSQVMLVPKNRKDEDGNQVWRFVMSHVDLNKNCKFRHFDMPKPRELLARLPRESKFFHFMDAMDSFDSVKLRDDQCAYTAFQIPRKDGKGHEFIGNTRVPQGSLNSTGTLIKVYRELFGDLDEYLKWYCDDAIASSTSQGIF